jgi:hypothetical protein
LRASLTNLVVDHFEDIAVFGANKDSVARTLDASEVTVWEWNRVEKFEVLRPNLHHSILSSSNETSVEGVDGIHRSLVTLDNRSTARV